MASQELLRTLRLKLMPCCSVSSPNAYIEQDNYLCHISKPYKLSCVELKACLCNLNYYMRLLPGIAEPGTPPYEDNNLKVLFYNMMLYDWQDDFDAF